MESLVDEPSQVTGFGNVDVMGHIVVEQHIHSTRWHFNERCGFQGQSELGRSWKVGRSLAYCWEFGQVACWGGRWHSCCRQVLWLLAPWSYACVWQGLTGLEVFEVDWHGQLMWQGSPYDVVYGINASIEPDHDIHSNVDVMRQVWDDEEVMTQMSVVPSYVQSADDLGGCHGCRPWTEMEAAVLSDVW